MQTIPSSAPVYVPFDQWPDLASWAVGGKTLWASDDFFANREMLLNPSPPIFIADKYITQGKWMDGWESRRKRVPGAQGLEDQCILQLGIPGQIFWINIDTSFFTGNFPEYVQIEGYEDLRVKRKGTQSKKASTQEPFKDVPFTVILKKTALKGNTQNLFPISASGRFTHLKIRSYPDGGIARIRVHGSPRPLAADLKGTVNLGALALGAQVIAASDVHYGSKDHLIAPGRAKHMGEGWETKRSRGRLSDHNKGFDWIVIKLAARARVERVEVDTHHYKGNFPHACSVELLDLGPNAPDVLPCDLRDCADFEFREVLPYSLLKADHVHAFTKQLVKNVAQEGATHLRLKIYPDGGVSRLRVFGSVI